MGIDLFGKIPEKNVSFAAFSKMYGFHGFVLSPFLTIGRYPIKI